ncbi:hypothetical protein BH11CYA1_BH11CYA1_23650 [soil metagenome]
MLGPPCWIGLDELRRRLLLCGDDVVERLFAAYRGDHSGDAATDGARGGGRRDHDFAVEGRAVAVLGDDGLGHFGGHGALADSATSFQRHARLDGGLALAGEIFDGDDAITCGDTADVQKLMVTPEFVHEGAADVLSAEAGCGDANCESAIDEEVGGVRLGLLGEVAHNDLSLVVVLEVNCEFGDPNTYFSSVYLAFMRMSEPTKGPSRKRWKARLGVTRRCRAMRDDSR